jgi:hypothetical protein
MWFRVAVAFVAVALAACNPTPPQQAAATATPSPVRALPNCAAPVTAIYAIHVSGVNGGVSGDSIFCVSASSTTDFNTLALEGPAQNRQLLAADARSIVQVDGANVDGSNVIRVFDPASEGTRGLGTLSSLGIGDAGPLGGVMSPDGTQVAIAGAHKLLLVDLSTGTPRTVATVAGDRWLMPIRWTASGIIASKVPYEGMGDYGLLKIDPVTGAVVTINQGPNNQLVMSPDGNFMVTTTHLDLGDGPTVRYPWQNAIDLTGPDGHVTRIAKAKNRWFTPLDATNDGKVLFGSDSQGDSLAPDMGLYLAQPDGQLKQQTALDFSYQLTAARFLGASNALVAHFVGGSGSRETGLGLQVVHMCPPTEAGCQVQWSGDAIYNGKWPTTITSMVMLSAAA